MTRSDKGYRADAAQFFVAGELCRRELVAVVTMGNCPNTDILVSNSVATRFVHVQVKAFIPGGGTCAVGLKAEKDFGKSFFWVLAGIPAPESTKAFEFFVIPSLELSKAVSENHRIWEATPGMNGQARSKENKFRAVHLPPLREGTGWSLEPFRSRWDLIVDAVRD
ncbi:MAG: hypothetical protein ABI639_02905 [Thermoanaerobaculia bacterium]